MGNLPMKTRALARAAAAAFLIAGATGLSACGGDQRDAEATTDNAQAQVSTTAPENAVSDSELNAAAVNAVTAADPAGAPFVSDGAGDTTSVTTAPAQ
jgi:hypothetical protein